MYMKHIIFISIISAMILNSCSNTGQDKGLDINAEYDTLVKTFEAKIKPLFRESALAYWNASISGKDEDYEKSLKADLAANMVLADTQLFSAFKRIKESGQITDSVKIRELNIIYNSMLPKQIDSITLRQMIELQNRIEQKFSVFRAEIDGKKVSDNDIESILSNSTDSKELEKAWVSVKMLGPEVSQDIIQLVKLRNKAAKEIGFRNYHEMKLTLDDQNPLEVEQLFVELDNLTRESFVQLKGEIDEFLSKRLMIKKDELMPWHYQNRFFQEAPKIYNIDLDTYYKDKDVVEITKEFFKGIGMEIEDILNNSDLYEKEGKNQHAYCTDIDNEGDIRVLCNVKPDYKWMGTMLHEFGHATYDKYINSGLPYSLREPAHTFTTEAIAMLFGRLASNASFMKEMLKINDSELKKITAQSFGNLRLEQLVFSRWAQVMYNFEKEMYANPDQNLNKLWWDLVEKYQMMKRPPERDMPDWATKTHIATSPCYYHNYLLGELLASQLNAYIVNNIVSSDDIRNPVFTGSQELGKFLIEKVFKPGRKYYWNEMIEKATGEKLTAKYYAEQFVK